MKCYSTNLSIVFPPPTQYHFLSQSSPLLYCNFDRRQRQWRSWWKEKDWNWWNFNVLL